MIEVKVIILFDATLQAKDEFIFEGLFWAETIPVHAPFVRYKEFGNVKTIRLFAPNEFDNVIKNVYIEELETTEVLNVIFVDCK